jgi:hypothetical protein
MIEICHTLGTYQNSKSLTVSCIRAKKAVKENYNIVLVILAP